MRKSAPFQAGANLEPLCCPLQAAVRFFRTPIPAPPTARLTACLPSIRYPETKARNRAYHVPFHADPHPRGSIRLAPACFPMAPRRRAPTCQESNLPFTFWFKPDSSFGLFVFTEIQTAIHLCCAYGTCLAFTPHRCLQCRSPRRRVNRLLRSTLSPELQTRPFPVTHVQVGNCWSHSRSRNLSPGTGGLRV
jgi:hypothetical protein